METQTRLNKHDLANVRAIGQRLETYGKRKASIEARLARIDAEYAALADKAKAKVMAELAAVKADMEFWEAPVVARYGATVAELLSACGGAAKGADAAVAQPADSGLPDPEPGVYPPLPDVWK